MSDYCRWIEDADVAGGRFLVPGCWNRIIHGDDAECQCETITYPDDLEDVERCPHCGQITKGSGADESAMRAGYWGDT